LKHLGRLLTLPGSGVFTVHSGQERKDKILKSYFGTASHTKAHQLWLKSIKNISTSKPLIIGIPSDCGGGIHRGANWGPLALREEMISEKNHFQDLGDVRVIPHLLHDKYINQETIRLCRKSLYGKDIKLPVSPLSIAEKALELIYDSYPSAKILGLGGDHSTSYPLVKSWLSSRKNKKKCALIHFDAHTDLLDKRLGIDLCFGTWAYHILNSLSSADHIIQLGIRSSGKSKKYWKETLGVEQYWADEINRLGVNKTYQKIKKHFNKLGVEEIYVSFDIDALDAKYASTTGTPEVNGLLPSDCAALLHLLKADFNITGADLMEVAPFISFERKNESDRIASLAVAGDMAKLLLNLLK
jgi:agmatinase